MEEVRPIPKFRFKGTWRKLEETISFLQKIIDLCDYEIEKGYIYRPTNEQSNYITRYRDTKEVYSGLLQICYESEKERR